MSVRAKAGRIDRALDAAADAGGKPRDPADPGFDSEACLVYPPVMNEPPRP
jgi:hypothetical protein